MYEVENRVKGVPIIVDIYGAPCPIAIYGITNV